MLKTNKIRLMEQSQELSFDKAFEEFLTFCKTKNLSEATLRNYRLQFKTLSTFVDTSSPVSVIDQSFIQSYILNLQGRMHNPETINTALRTFRVLVNYWSSLKYCQSVKFKLLKTEIKIKEVYTDAELQLLLRKPDIKKSSFTEYRTWVVINFLIATGCRLRTLINVRIKDIDFDNEVVSLQVTKNRRAQLLPLPQSMLTILKEYIKIRSNAFETKPEDVLFCSETGTQLYDTTVNHNINKYNRNRGVNKTGVHLFRHTFSKNFIMSGGDCFRLQRQLGHSTLEMSKRYANIWDKDLQQNFEKFNLLERLKAPQQKIKMAK